MDIVSIVAIVTAAGAIIIGIFNHVKHSSCCGVDIENFESQQAQPQPQQAPTRIIEIVEPEPYTYSHEQQYDNDIYNRRHNRPPHHPHNSGYRGYDLNAHMKYST